MDDEKVDKRKGHVKEAVGDLTDDKDLEREGKLDRASGGVKEKVSDVSDRAKDALSRERE